MIAARGLCWSWSSDFVPEETGGVRGLFRSERTGRCRRDPRATGAWRFRVPPVVEARSAFGRISRLCDGSAGRGDHMEARNRRSFLNPVPGKAQDHGPSFPENPTPHPSPGRAWMRSSSLARRWYTATCLLAWVCDARGPGPWLPGARRRSGSCPRRALSGRSGRSPGCARAEAARGHGVWRA